MISAMWSFGKGIVCDFMATVPSGLSVAGCSIHRICGRSVRTLLIHLKIVLSDWSTSFTTTSPPPSAAAALGAAYAAAAPATAPAVCSAAAPWWMEAVLGPSRGCMWMFVWAEPCATSRESFLRLCRLLRLDLTVTASLKAGFTSWSNGSFGSGPTLMTKAWPWWFLDTSSMRTRRWASPFSIIMVESGLSFKYSWFVTDR
mmetsp:Transcript_34549/g.80043  ORF Transcript_34549/g.80043 Transcript_34549/m.80043 type:complete len:201 (-) Transcript_34549:828-1430(-)